MNLTETAHLTEVALTAVAIPGLVLWIINWTAARRDYAIARFLGAEKGVRQEARFEIFHTLVLAAVELVYIYIGLLSLATPQYPGAGDFYENTVWLARIVTAAAILELGRRWTQHRTRQIGLARLVEGATGHMGPPGKTGPARARRPPGGP